MCSTPSIRRIDHHPTLAPLPARRRVRISVDDREIDALEGEPIVAALLASGILIARTSVETASPRGYFCGVGRCGDCQMIVDGMPNVRTCVTPVSDGQVIETQHAAGQWRARS